MTEHDEGLLQGMLDQAAADIPALRNLERWGIEQFNHAQRLQAELCETRKSHYQMMLVVLAEFFIIVVLAAVVWAKA